MDDDTLFGKGAASRGVFPGVTDQSGDQRRATGQCHHDRLGGAF